MLRRSVTLILLIVICVLIGLAHPVSDLDARRTQAYINLIGMREWRHLPLWQPYRETGQAIPLQLDPAEVLPPLMAGMANGIAITAALQAILAGTGGWLLLRLLRIGNLAALLIGVASAVAFADHYAFVWLLAALIGLTLGEPRYRRPFLIVVLLAALLWLNGDGLTDLSVAPASYISLLALMLIVAYSATHPQRDAIRLAIIVAAVAILFAVSAQRWIAEIAIRNAPTSIPETAIAACLDALPATPTTALISVLAPGDPRLELVYLMRRLRRESATRIDHQPDYAISSVDANANIDLRTQGYVELTRSPRLSGDAPNRCLYLNPGSVGYAYAMPINNQGKIIPLPALVHALDQIVLRVQSDSQQAYRLVISEQAADGWQAWIDGAAVTVASFNGMIALEPPPASSGGVREISVQYRPLNLVIAGWSIVVASLISIGYLLRLDRFISPSLRQKLTPHPERLLNLLRRIFKRIYDILMSPVADD
ncbi:MAG: hypothetical protein KF726_05935 [Anaerolineae bacterium]|nr:hypothetical protein [Anaerolineae bacterium]